MAVFLFSQNVAMAATTGQVYPTLGTTVAESPWLDNTWTTPTNIYSDNAATANVTAPSYDNGDQTYVLKATGFDFSAIPDGSTINGITARINAFYRSGQGSGSLDLCQLLDISRAKVGTNNCSTPTALTTTTSTIITKGGTTDTWGNALTTAWVKDPDFGIAMGVLATAVNADVDVDYVTLEITYTPPTTTLGNGTDPGNTSLAPSGSATMADAFTFVTSGGTDAITAVVVGLATGTSGGLSLVEITDDAGSVVYGSTANPATDTPSILLSGLTATTGSTQYKIRVTPKTHANMPVPPGSTYSVTAKINSWTGTNTQVGSDTAGTTVTIDNTSPAGTTGANAVAGDTQVSVNWTNPADADFQKVIIYCKTSSITESPTEGSDPSVDGTACDATARVKYSGSTSPQVFTGLTNSTTYYFRIYARDTNGNFTALASTQQVSATPSPTPTTTLGTGSDPVATTIAPGASATDVNQFTLQTNTGSETVTSVTVNLSTNSGVGRLAITTSGGTELGFTTSPVTGSNTISVSGMSAGTSATTFKVRVTPFSHSAMPAVPGGSYAITAPVTSWAGSYAHTGSDTNTNALTIDNASPANVTSATGSAGNAQVSLSWTNPADSDFHSTVVLRRATSAVADVPVEGTTYVVGNTIGTATVACVVASPTATCVDGSLNNGTAYHYKVFSKDSNGNYAAGVVPTGSPFTPVAPIYTTTIGNGTNPSSVTLAPSDSITDLDTFTFITSGNTDSVTALTVTLTGTNSFQSLSEVRVTDNAGSTTYFSAVTNPGSNSVSFSGGTPIPVTTSSATFKVRITPKTHANMPVPPGVSYSVGGTVTSFTSANGQAGTDSTSATITIDNLSPSGATSVSGSSSDAQVTLNWTTSASSDFSRSVMLRWTGASAGSEVPAEGTDYANSNTITTATVVCVRTADAASTAVSGVDGAGTGGCSSTPLTNSQAYTYKVFQKDSRGNYDVGVAVGTFTPSPTPTTTLGTGSDPVATTIAPGASATDVNQFTLQTNTGSETVTSVTVNLSTNSGVGRLAITTSGGTELGFTTSPVTGSNTISVSGMSAVTSATIFKVRVTPFSHSAMPAVPGGSYAITAPVTSWAGSYAHTGSDTNTNALTIDNASPANVTSATGSAGNAQVSLSWTNPADSDFHSTIVLRRATSAVADVPVEGTTYIVGNTIGTATVACVVASPTATCVDGSLNNGTAYHYKVFSKDSNGNYAAGVVPTGSPFTPSLSTFTITSSAGSGGTISPLGVTNVAQGSSQSYTITPNLGYDVATLTIDGSPTATSTSYSFNNVQTNHTIAVTFIQVTPTYTIISTAATNGAINPLGTTVFLQGASQTYTITPTLGYVVETLVVDSVSIATSTSHTFTNITANHTIDATFSLIPPPPGTFAITATAGTGGSISPSGVTIVTQGNNQSYTITPNSGYRIATLTVDSVSIATSTSYTFTNVQTNHTIDATFVALPPGAAQPDTGSTRATTITFSGWAFPGGKISIIDKQLNTEKIIGREEIANNDGSFSVSFIGVLQALHSFGLIIKDTSGRVSQSKLFFINTISDDLVVKNFITPPTISLSKNQVTRGEKAYVEGSATPNYTLRLELDGILFKEILVGSDGVYKIDIPTGTLEFGNHTIRSKQLLETATESEFSISRTFTVSRLAVVQADLSGDGKIDIRDWSIFLSLWGSKSATGRQRIDFSTDGKIDIADFSIFIKTIRKK